MKEIKCVTVGDGTVGKTCMLMSYKTNTFPRVYIPTVFENYETRLTVDKQALILYLWDIAGQEDFDCLRPLTYSQTEVFLVCFAVNSVSSFQNVKRKWIPEIRRHSPDIPYLLIGTKSDLREGSSNVVSIEEGQRMAKDIGALNYFECSALTRVGLNEVFENAARAVIYGSENHYKRCTCM